MITESQKAERKTHIGASEVAALFTDPETGKSLSPFQTAADIWAAKCFDIEDAEASDAQDRGNRYEAALIEFAEVRLGTHIETSPDCLRFICAEHPILACNLDGITDDKEIVECKTTGMASEWGEPETDQVPFRVLLQVQHQMLCTGFKVAHIVVLMGKWGLAEEMYRVEANDAIQQAIITRAEQFWNDYVLTKTPPPDSEPGDISLFKRIIRQPEKIADVPVDLISEWELHKETRIALEKKEKEVFAKILVRLGDAEGAPAGEGRMLTYFSQNGKRETDFDLLEKKYPKAYAATVTQGKHRVARIVTIK